MTDPICGMYVEPERAAGSGVYSGETYYFCSRRCLAKFKEDPEKFMKSPAAVHAAHSHGHAHEHAAPSEAKFSEVAHSVYVCPMDPEVRESKPGPCPKCGMALEPAAPAAPSVKTEYVCPMHPEIVRPEPGACPICGMALEPRTVTLGGRSQSRVGRYDAAVLGRRGPERCRSLLLAMSEMIPGQPLQRSFSPRLLNWIQLLLATPVVLWGGWPFFRARLAVHREPQSEHVHADRHRRRHGLCI